MNGRLFLIYFGLYSCRLIAAIGIILLALVVLMLTGASHLCQWAEDHCDQYRRDLRSWHSELARRS